jgi:hypothetical protein
MLRLTTLASLLLLVSGTREVAAQRRAPGQATGEGTEVSVIARVGTKSYTSRISGTCKHEPSASIYDLPAALWTVEGTGGDGSEIKQLNLRLWRPKNGSADQISLSLEAGSTSARVDVNPRDQAVGAATVQLQPVGPGGKFEVKGKDAKGSALNLTISCPMFAGIEAEGG